MQTELTKEEKKEDSNSPHLRELSPVDQKAEQCEKNNENDEKNIKEGKFLEGFSISPMNHPFANAVKKEILAAKTGLSDFQISELVEKIVDLHLEFSQSMINQQEDTPSPPSNTPQTPNNMPPPQFFPFPQQFYYNYPYQQPIFPPNYFTPQQQMPPPAPTKLQFQKMPFYNYQ